MVVLEEVVNLHRHQVQELQIKVLMVVLDTLEILLVAVAVLVLLPLEPTAQHAASTGAR